jgi:hypothetical protein
MFKYLKTVVPSVHTLYSLFPVARPAAFDGLSFCYSANAWRPESGALLYPTSLYEIVSALFFLFSFSA